MTRRTMPCTTRCGGPMTEDRRAAIGQLRRFQCGILVTFILAASCLGAMITCGMVIVKPIAETNSLEFEETTCTTAMANFTGEDVDCKCGKHCHSSFPCLRIVVSYADDDGATFSGVLYEDEKRLNKHGHKGEDFQCVTAPCDRSVRFNKEEVDRFKDKFPVGTSFKCLYNPDNTNQVLVRRLYTWNDMFHSMFWSTLGFLLLISLLVYFIFKCKGTARKLSRLPVVMPHAPGTQTTGQFLPPPYPGGPAPYPQGIQSAPYPYPQALQPPPYSNIDSKDEKGFTFT
ncbi:calcium-activated potassium channel subunit beta-2-like isoform X1 [Branchiostoma floridae x Branchiostoma belcheri]